MNFRILFKSFLGLMLVITLVLIGMNNRDPVRFALPPLVHSIKQPAAIMYTAFLALGFLAGAVMTSGKTTAQVKAARSAEK
jgi:uncharacterized integral membrane protein